MTSFALPPYAGGVAVAVGLESPPPQPTATSATTATAALRLTPTPLPFSGSEGSTKSLAAPLPTGPRVSTRSSMMSE